MKLHDLVEMTHRTGTMIEINPVLDQSHPSLSPEAYDGKTYHLNTVVTQRRGDIVFYITKKDDEVLGYIQTHQRQIPRVGNVIEVLYVHVYPSNQTNKLSLEMIKYLSDRHGYNVLLGNKHFLPTEKGLMKYFMTTPFRAYMVNVNTGDQVPCTASTYEQLTSTTHYTDWQVLLLGQSATVEGQDFGFGGEKFNDTYMWALSDWFTHVKD